MTAFTALTSLTLLSLNGWPIHDVDLLPLTRLSRLRFIDFSDCKQLTSLCFMPLLQFPHLHTLEIVREDDWLIDSIVAMFEVLRPDRSVKLTL